MRKLLFLLLTLIAMPACSDCGLVTGDYANVGGSEESTSLLLVANKTFTLEHGTWQPGQYKNRQISKVEGTWSCKQNQVTLKVKNEVVTAKVVLVGENPLGIKVDTKVLSFSSNSGFSFNSRASSKMAYLANEILYPTSAVSH